MKLEALTIRDLLDKVNNEEGGLYLPQVQRPYVWGSRYQSEKYVCKLLDSIIRQYPIGTLIIWEAKKKIPYRKFLEDYKDGMTTEFVEENLFERKDKYLVYDGQQRIQTIYSCLRHTFNNKILVYDLDYELEVKKTTENEEEKEEEIEESLEANEFKFIDANNEEILKKNRNYIPMNLLTRQNEKYKIEFRKSILAKYADASEEIKTDIEKKFERLWNVFVVKSDVGINTYSPINYFLIDSDCEESRINEIFQRLNMGGMVLSNADLLLSKIKAKDYAYEQKLQDVSAQIETFTNGYELDYTSILQLIHFIVKNTLKINPEKITNADIEKFIYEFEPIKKCLETFFKFFISEEFHINNSGIIPKKYVLYPLMLYVYNLDKLHINFREIDTQKMKKYFILSQLNDWNTQTIVENCCKLINEAKNEFPLSDIEKYISTKANRKIDIEPEDFEKEWWFVLKILMKSREFSFKNIGTRLKPELDHIFPIRLEEHPDDYEVNVIWNMQPVTGQINNDKKNKHPKAFFESDEGQKYIDSYDFIDKDLNSIIWDDHKEFIKYRKKKMVDNFNKTYGFDLKIND